MTTTCRTCGTPLRWAQRRQRPRIFCTRKCANRYNATKRASIEKRARQYDREDELRAIAARVLTMNPSRKSIGRTLRRQRVSRGVSQEVLAAVAGCNPKMVIDAELGRRNISIDNLASIAAILNLTLIGLLERARDEERDSRTERVGTSCANA